MIALYRKKRPSTFGNVVGQNPIITTLRNQLKNLRLSHAYLFCGTRGTGKTSAAKIFARALNCQYSRETGEPCNECTTCKDILAERSLNVTEIDAASNNGVDNIRDLREEVKYPPTVGAYKVYIIDEAHMLTTAAFNALLKTLEEPPAHIVFIFATTDPSKIPVTIMSRCQRYDFKRITRADVVATLAAYMKDDNIIVEQEALEYIASVSDGAMRDALSILDQCISLYLDETLTLEKVKYVLGAVDQSILFEYGDALVAYNTAKALDIIAEVAKEGLDFSRFINDVIMHFRNLLVASQVTNPADILDYSQETANHYRTKGLEIAADILMNYIKEFFELQNQIRFLPKERLALEVCTIKLCNNSAIPTSEPIKIPQQQTPKQTPTIAPAQTQKPERTPSVEPRNENNLITYWSDFCNTLDGNVIKSSLLRCKVSINGDITIDCLDDTNLGRVKKAEGEITEKLRKYFGIEGKNIIFVVQKKPNSSNTFREELQSQVNMQIEFS
ncbi:MAG: DNA polymerase III subunit gamma/tau [Turicibacter sp.]|nr:DNA polymerase III subunit gamma/tau [Turicibacter sp.]